MRPVLLALLAFCAPLGVRAAATPPAVPAKTTPARPTPFVMSGTVRDASGRPLAGVEVSAANTVAYDVNVVGRTDAQGRYRLELPHDIGTWRPYASVSRPWGNQVFRFTVYPDDPSSFAARTGATRDFVWRLSGPHDGGVLGQPVNVYGGEDIDWDTLELTFTPDGPLVDGSAGKTLVRRPTGSRIADVPVGRYRVSARHAPHGTPEALDVEAEGQEAYTGSSPATFRETSYGIRMEVYLRRR